MKRRHAARGGALILSVLGLLVFAPAALAGTVRYTVQQSSAYTIQDNGSGIVKVIYNGCVTAGARQTIAFRAVTNVSEDANATWSVLREEGEAPTASFNPPGMFLQRGPDQTWDVVLSFTLNDENDGATTFRAKLDPESGEGLGQGAGIMVRIPCVVAAGSSFPSPAGSSNAPCVRVVPVRLRAGERARLRVVVSASDQRVSRALVRVSGAGVSERGRTNSNGVARFVIRPRRAGVVYVQSNVCAGADRLAVRGRQSRSNVLPQNTG